MQFVSLDASRFGFDVGVGVVGDDAAGMTEPPLNTLGRLTTARQSTTRPLRGWSGPRRCCGSVAAADGRRKAVQRRQFVRLQRERGCAGVLLQIAKGLG